MFKLSTELKTQLLPHQERVKERLKHQPGLLVAHGLGSGKTLSSLAAAVDTDGRTTALIPASLIPNYEKEIAKHVKGKLPIDIKSQQRAVKHPEELSPTDLLIVDEAHRARETSSKLQDLLENYPATKRLLLTGTPVYNRPSDIAPLVNIVAGTKVLPTGREFNKRYLDIPPSFPGFFYRLMHGDKQPTLKNEKELGKILNKWVDYHGNDTGDFPSRQDEEIRVPMSEEQTALHRAAWGKMPRSLRSKLEAGVIPKGKDLSAFNAFESQTRQISGSTDKYLQSKGVSPKVQRAVNSLKEKLEESPRAKAVVYSNYLNALQDYQKELKNNKIPAALFTGETSAKDRAQAISDYNKGALKALLLSSAGGEGLDLSGTRLVQVLEPHWNDEKLNQVIGRAIRHGSHAHLPESERNVDVQHYLSYPQPTRWESFWNKDPKGVEDFLHNMSKRKKMLNDQLLDLLKKNQS